jgi:hypothetical protein
MSSNENFVFHAWILELRHLLFSSKASTALIAAATLVAIVCLLFWAYSNAFFDSRRTKTPDLSELFKDGPDPTMGDGDFLDLRDPGCTKSFSLRIAQRVFTRMSRNCKYSIYVDSGQARANFLNAAKGAVELAPGRSWTATDFWSIRPLTPEADVRLEPTP